MRNRRWWMGSLWPGLFLLAWATAGADEASRPAIEAAKAEASTWLALVDAGRYDESWQSTTPELKKYIPLLAWEQEQFTRRVELGALMDRVLTSARLIPPMMDRAPGFIELKYATRFEASDRVEEVLMVTRTEDGHWHPGAYGFNDPGRSPISDARIRNILRDRIDRAKRGVGIVAGMAARRAASPPRCFSTSKTSARWSCSATRKTRSTTSPSTSCIPNDLSTSSSD